MGSRAEADADVDADVTAAFADFDGADLAAGSGLGASSRLQPATDAIARKQREAAKARARSARIA